MQAGSVLVYSGSVFHGGGENHSTTDRVGLNITYSLGYYSPPGAPGEGPNIAPPQYALGHRDVEGALGSPEELAHVLQETSDSLGADGS